MYEKKPGKEIGKVMNYNHILVVIQQTVSGMKDVELLKKVTGIINERIHDLTHEN